MNAPSAERFDAIWTPESAVEHANPGGGMLRTSFDGDVEALADFVETVESASEYDSNWEDKFRWSWALWELYTRLNQTVPVVLTTQSSGALSWFGAPSSGDVTQRIQTLQRFRDHYTSLLGHPTRETAHQRPIKTELDELLGVVQTLETDRIAAQIKGEYGDFYRSLYGGAATPTVSTGRVELTDVGPLVRAYAAGKANDAYTEDDSPAFWGGTHWERWKEPYADYFESEIRTGFALDDLGPEDIDPLFKAITTTERAQLDKPVVSFIMGSQWGQYAWNDVVDHFRTNPVEASSALSVFFDESRSVVNRLDAFRAHTIHLTETEDRSPGLIQRMATSLLMFAHPDDHLGLPSSRTRAFLNAKTTLDSFESGFRPQQYRTIIGPLRALRDEIEAQLREYGSDKPVSMLDVHSMIWIYGKAEQEPTSDHIPS